MSIFSRNRPRIAPSPTIPAVPKQQDSERRDGGLCRRHTVAVLDASAHDTPQGSSRRFPNGFQLKRKRSGSPKRSRSIATTFRRKNACSECSTEQETPNLTPRLSPSRTGRSESSSSGDSSDCAISDDDEPLAKKEPVKKEFTRSQVQEALQNLNCISTAAEAVSEKLKATVAMHKKWRLKNLYLASLDTSDGCRGQPCGKCEVPRFRWLDVMRDCKMRLCNFCCQCRCCEHPRAAAGLSTAPKIGSTSAPCFNFVLAGAESDLHHLSLTHMALSVTLKRLIKDSRFLSHRNQLKIAEALRFNFKLRETGEIISYWLDLERVLQDWGWVIPPPAMPRDWEELRELCTIEVAKAKSVRWSTLGDYNARLLLVGHKIMPGDVTAACIDDFVCSREVSLEVMTRAAQIPQEKKEKESFECDDKPKRRKSSGWLELSIVLMNRLRGVDGGDGETGK